MKQKENYSAIAILGRVKTFAWCQQLFWGLSTNNNHAARKHWNIKYDIMDMYIHNKNKASGQKEIYDVNYVKDKWVISIDNMIYSKDKG